MTACAARAGAFTGFRPDDSMAAPLRSASARRSRVATAMFGPVLRLAALALASFPLVTCGGRKSDREDGGLAAPGPPTCRLPYRFGPAGPSSRFCAVRWTYGAKAPDAAEASLPAQYCGYAAYGSNGSHGHARGIQQGREPA